jgi:hypothetical protein
MKIVVLVHGVGDNRLLVSAASVMFPAVAVGEALRLVVFSIGKLLLDFLGLGLFPALSPQAEKAAGSDHGREEGAFLGGGLDG